MQDLKAANLARLSSAISGYLNALQPLAALAYFILLMTLKMATAICSHSLHPIAKVSCWHRDNRSWHKDALHICCCLLHFRCCVFQRLLNVQTVLQDNAQSSI